MKKVIKYITILIFLFSIVLPCYAKDLLIGVVDTQKIIMESNFYTAVKSAEDEMKQLEKKLQDDMLKMDKELEELRKKGVGQEELNKKRKQFEQDLTNTRLQAQTKLQLKQLELEKLREQFKRNLEEAIKEVAKEKKLDIVLDKQLVLFGGTDITEDVTKKVNKK